MFRFMSIRNTLVAVFLLVSVIPMVAMMEVGRRESTEALNQQIETDLTNLALANASLLDSELQSMEATTKLAADQASFLLARDIDPEEMEEILYQYRRDERGMLSRDAYHRAHNMGSEVSNVTIGSDIDLTEELKRQVAVTEDYDSLFRAMQGASPDSVWFYIATEEGLHRTYPWFESTGIENAAWDVRTRPYYVGVRKTLKSYWTPPFMDAFGSGAIVTNAAPMFDDRGQFIGMMAQDITLQRLQGIVEGIGPARGSGYSFLMDSETNLIVSPPNVPTSDVDAGMVKMSEVASGELAEIIEEMRTTDEARLDYFEDENGVNIIAYAPIHTTAWSLGIVLPQKEAVSPITRMVATIRLYLGVAMVFALVLALLLASAISRPIVNLTEVARAIQYNVQFPTDTLKKVSRGRDEISRLGIVFGSMVSALNARVTELKTVYSIGQSISSSVDLEETLITVLNAVRTIIPYDAAEICLYDKKENKLVVNAWAGATGETGSNNATIDTTGRTYDVGRGYTGWIAKHKHSLLVPYADDETAIIPTTREISPGVYLNSFVGVPLMIGDTLVGTLELISTRSGGFGVNSVQVLSNIAPQAAIAIQNATLVQKRERALKQQIEMLRVEIDEVRRKKEVAEIVETDYFQDVKEKARELRARFGKD